MRLRFRRHPRSETRRNLSPASRKWNWLDPGSSAWNLLLAEINRQEIEIAKLLNIEAGTIGPYPVRVGVLLDQHPIVKRLKWHGLDISIETMPAGQKRSSQTRQGNKWSVEMTHDYGYIRGTEGVDGDHLDCFLGHDEKAQYVYVVQTRKAPRFIEADEDKCMLNFSSPADAKAAFLANYDRPEHFGEMRTIPVGEFIDKALRTAEVPALIDGRGSHVDIFVEAPILKLAKQLTKDFKPEDIRHECAYCKKVMSNPSGKVTSHGICPECMEKVKKNPDYVGPKAHDAKGVNRHYSQMDPREAVYEVMSRNGPDVDMYFRRFASLTMRKVAAQLGGPGYWSSEADTGPDEVRQRKSGYRKVMAKSFDMLLGRGSGRQPAWVWERW